MIFYEFISYSGLSILASSVKTNYFDSVIPKKVQSFEKLNKKVIKCRKRVSITRSKLFRYDKISGWRRL